MHEMSFAAGVLEKMLEFAFSHPDRRLVEVKLAVGVLTCIDPEQLAFCYEAIAAGTVVAGSTLTMEPVEAIVKCAGCGYHGSPKLWDDGLASALAFAAPATLCCPECGGTAEALQGHECAIRSVRYTTSSLAAP